MFSIAFQIRSSLVCLKDSAHATPIWRFWAKTCDLEVLHSLAPGSSGEGTPNGRIDLIADEAHRPVSEQQIHSLGMAAARRDYSLEDAPSVALVQTGKTAGVAIRTRIVWSPRV